MAEVRLRCGRGAYNFSQKTCSRYLLENQNKQSKRAAQASSPSAELLLGDIQRGQRRGAGRAEDIWTGGVTGDSYTTGTPLCGPVDRVRDRVRDVLDREYLSARSRRTVWSARPQQMCVVVCWGQRQGQWVFTRSYSDHGARSEPLYKSKTGYYELLEVSPTATHTQIKTAYYKQSFVYHPDRNADSEDATVRFSEISEAYAVLGNKALRRKYDRGLLSRSDLNATAKPSAKDPGAPAGERTGSRGSVVGADSRGGVFDFDKFYKAHYSEQLQRERDLKMRKEEMQRKKDETIAEKKMGRMMEMGVVVLITMALGLVSSLK